MTLEFRIAGRRGLPRSGADQIPTGAGRPPRIACLLALAHRFDELICSGIVKDYAELARLGHVTRARLTQIMNLLALAPEIQEYLLWLSSNRECAMTERDLRRIAAEVRWDRQRALFLRYTKMSLGVLRGGPEETGSGMIPD